MTDRPIIFSGPMVRALLEGRKTQTRRIVKEGRYADSLKGRTYTGEVVNYYGDHRLGMLFSCDKRGTWDEETNPEGTSDAVLPLPYAIGDRLWVREAFGIEPARRMMVRHGERTETFPEEVHYRAHDETLAGMKWRPSIHMPRWASRLTLTVTDVRVQRLQEISEEDAKAEGVYKLEPSPDDLEWYAAFAEEHGFDPSVDPMEGVWMAPGTRQGWGMTKEQRDKELWGPTAQFAYRCLWDFINAKRGHAWNANPWIVALTFTVEQRNIDG